MRRDPWTNALAAWQRASLANTKRGAALDGRRHEQGFALAESVGLPRHATCIHNASIDDKLIGWCHGDPDKLATAKRAARLLSCWRGSRAARRMNQASLDRLIKESSNG